MSQTCLCEDQAVEEPTQASEKFSEGPVARNVKLDTNSQQLDTCKRLCLGRSGSFDPPDSAASPSPSQSHASGTSGPEGGNCNTNSRCSFTFGALLAGGKLSPTSWWVPGGLNLC